MKPRDPSICIFSVISLVVFSVLGVMYARGTYRGVDPVSQVTRAPSAEYGCPAYSLLEAERNGTITPEQRSELERQRIELLRQLGHVVEI